MEKRWQSHVKNSLKNDKLHFLKAIRKYPLDSWIHEILEKVETREEANIREIYWIAHFQSNDPNVGYNMTFGGEGGQTSSSEELSKRMKGIPKSIQHRQNMCKAQQQYWLDNPDSAKAKRQSLIERNKTPEARQAAREAQNRRWLKPGAREALSKRMSQRIVSDETRHRNSETMTALWNDHSYRSKMIEIINERPSVSDETRQKLSESHKGLKYKTRKDKGTKRGPLKSSVTCQVCGRTMKFITKRHKCI